MKIVVLGAPGAGKGTQAKKLSEKYDIPHISTGDILRYNIQKRTDLGKKADGYMSNGKLVPDEIVLELIADRFKDSDCERGYILDGFPRTIVQAKALDERLASTGDEIQHAIDVKVPDSNIVDRMSGRRVCTKCGATYHIVSIPPKKENICDSCGSQLVLRDDDEEETVRERLRVYHKQTEPLINYYKEKGILKVVDGTKDLEEVFGEIVSVLEKDEGNR